MFSVESLFLANDIILMDNSNLRREQPPPPAQQPSLAQSHAPQPHTIIRQEPQNRLVSESRQSIQGEKRIEYIPYEKTIIEYEPITKIEYVPRERKVVEYYPVEYQTEYIPQVFQEKVIE